MLTVNRKENATSVRFSRVVSLVNENWPLNINVRQPKDAEPVWRVVRSHGKLNWAITISACWSSFEGLQSKMYTHLSEYGFIEKSQGKIEAGI